jgi:hypothetical protein
MTEASADVAITRYCGNRAGDQMDAQSKRKRTGSGEAFPFIEDTLPFITFRRCASFEKIFQSLYKWGWRAKRGNRSPACP